MSFKLGICLLNSFICKFKGRSSKGRIVIPFNEWSNISIITPNFEKFTSQFCQKSLHEKCPYFPAFGLNSKRYGVSLRIQSECGKIRTRKTPTTDTLHAVIIIDVKVSKGNCINIERILFIFEIASETVHKEEDDDRYRKKK